MEHTKCLIIGSGPAGYTAAIYATRANLEPIEYCGLQMGGQLTQTTTVENFPGYPDGVDGNQMMMDLRQQAINLGANIRDGVVVKADFSKRDRVFLPVLPATVSSIARRYVLLLAAATQPAKMHSTSRTFARRYIS